MRQRRTQQNRQDLNLAPIMNMVVILIPLLLLSIVFMSTGVINVTMPPLNPVSGETPDDEALHLTVAISDQGFAVQTRDGTIPGDGTCSVTVCLENDGDLGPLFVQAKNTASDDAVDRVLNAYNFGELYAVLNRLKTNHPGESKFTVTADDNVPYAVVTRVMDAARFRVTGETFESSSRFWASREKVEGARPESLFPDAVIAIAR